jgi:L,D-transpeptidase catalytic domain
MLKHITRGPITVGLVLGLLLGLLAITTPARAEVSSESPAPTPPVAVRTLVLPTSSTALSVKDTRPPNVCLGKSGKLLCASKLDQRLYVMYNGRVVKSAQARFGGLASDGTRNFTREGSFRVYGKMKAKISTAYRVWMYDILMFNGAQYIHFSEEFAKYGYKYGSHGCVGLRNRTFSTWLYNWAPIGTRVIVTPN